MTRVSIFVGEEMEGGNAYTQAQSSSVAIFPAIIKNGEERDRRYSEKHLTCWQRLIKYKQQENSVHFIISLRGLSLNYTREAHNATRKGTNTFLSSSSMLGLVLDTIIYIISFYPHNNASKF